MSALSDAETAAGEERSSAAKTGKRPLVYRQSVATRITHWVWAISLFFLLLSGLQIFNARPDLYIGHQSGFGFENSVLAIGAERTENGPIGTTTIFGHKFTTTGWLGLYHTADGGVSSKAFPGWATIPSYRIWAPGASSISFSPGYW